MLTSVPSWPAFTTSSFRSKANFRRPASTCSVATLVKTIAVRPSRRGHYPAAVGIVLWGSEVLKSDGVGIAQALDLMGARVRKDRFNRAETVELISLDELGRPRIDILGNTSVIFKNTFPGAIRLIHEAAELAAAADKPHEWNYVRRHTDELIANGIAPRLARALLRHGRGCVHGPSRRDARHRQIRRLHGYRQRVDERAITAMPICRNIKRSSSRRRPTSNATW
jgi:cobalamin biosynthesis Mg chelatase CobN